MSWLAVWLCAGGLFVEKAAGAFVPRAWVSGARVRAVLALLPPAMLGALVLTQAVGSSDGLTIDLRLLGLAVAAVALLLRAPFLLVLVLAVASTAIARLVV